MEARTFVLVHGAWHGGWCWQHVARLLRRQGHHVTTPTLSGLGELSGNGTADVSFESHVSDIVRHIELEDLDNVVLVGHSYGGAVITHVADKIPNKLDLLIYLDAQISTSGQSLMDGLASDIRDQRRAAIDQSGFCMTAPEPEAFGIVDPQLTDWVRSRLTPHPIKTYEQRCHLQNPLGAGLRCAFVVCTEPRFPSIGVFERKAVELGWPVFELATGHDAMLTAPVETARLLSDIATSDNTETTQDRDAILDTIGLYIDGWQGRPEMFAEAFEPDAWIFFKDKKGKLHKWLLADRFSEWAATGWKIEGQVRSITQSGDTATVILGFNNESCRDASFVDTLTFLKVNGQWRITNKTAVHRSRSGSEAPKLHL